MPGQLYPRRQRWQNCSAGATDLNATCIVSTGLKRWLIIRWYKPILRERAAQKNNVSVSASAELSVCTAILIFVILSPEHTYCKPWNCCALKTTTQRSSLICTDVRKSALLLPGSSRWKLDDSAALCLLTLDPTSVRIPWFHRFSQNLVKWILRIMRLLKSKDHREIQMGWFPHNIFG